MKSSNRHLKSSKSPLFVFSTLARVRQPILSAMVSTLALLTVVPAFAAPAARPSSPDAKHDQTILEKVLPQILKGMKRPDLRVHTRVQLGSNQTPVIDFSGRVTLQFDRDIVITPGNPSQAGAAADVMPTIVVASQGKVVRWDALRDEKTGLTKSTIGFYDVVAATRQNAASMPASPLQIHVRSNLVTLLDLEISSIDFVLSREAQAANKDFGVLKVNGTCAVRQSVASMGTDKVSMQRVACSYEGQYDFSDSSYKLSFDYDSSN